MLKPYMAYSRSAGSSEGAFLVLATNGREAKRLAWGYCSFAFDGQYTDLAVRLIKNPANVLLLAEQDKLNAGQPHVIDNPVSCFSCGFWGNGLTDDNLCSSCGEEPGYLLVELWKKEREKE